VHRIKGAALDELFQHPSVYLLGVDTLTEIVGRLKGTLFVAALNHSLHCRFAHILHRSQPEPDTAANHRKMAIAGVHIRRQNGNPLLPAFVDQPHHLVGIAEEAVEQGRHEFDRKVGLEIGCLVGNERIGGTVRLVEAIAGEFFHEIKDVIGLGEIDPVLFGPLEEPFPLRLHDRRVFLAHRPP